MIEIHNKNIIIGLIYNYYTLASENRNKTTQKEITQEKQQRMKQIVAKKPT